MQFRRLTWFCLTLWAVSCAAHAQSANWARYALISPTTTLSAGRLCYTDGKGIACDTNAPLYNAVGSGTASPTNVPAFRAHRNGVDQTVTASTLTAINFTTLDFDTTSGFNLTNDRYTPNVPGRYLATASTYCPDSTSYCQINILKNGATIAVNFQRGNSVNSAAAISTIVDMNGTTDYITAMVLNSGGTTITGSIGYTHFTASLLASGNGLISGSTALGDRITSGTSSVFVANNGPVSITFGGTDMANFSAGGLGITSGSLAVRPTGNGWVDLVGGSASNPGYIQFSTTDGVRRGYIGWNDGASRMQIASENGWNYSFTQAPLVGANVMWHAGNDGSGSGLDADTVDGVNPITSLSGDVTGSGSGAVATTIAANAVTSAKIADSAVTYSKLQNVSSNNRLLGRSTAGAGAVEELTIGSGLTLSAGTLSASGGSLPSCNNGETIVRSGGAWVCTSNPDSFAFTDLLNQTINVVVTSNIVPITGVVQAQLSISGDGTPSYRVCTDSACNSVLRNWSTTASTVNQGQYIQARLTSSASDGVTRTATIVVGSFSDAWTVTTAPPASISWHSGITYSSAAGVYPGCSAPTETLMNDESVATKGAFGSATTGLAAGIVADLGSAKAVSAVRFGGIGPQSCWGGCQFYFNAGGGSIIQYSTDNSTWTTVVSGITNYSDSSMQTRTFTSVTARYWRITNTGYSCTAQFRLGTF